MSDYDSSLPIRTENDGDVISGICDATVKTQQLKVNADGSIDTNFATGSKIIVTDGTDDLEINADGSVNVKQDKLDSSTDSVEIKDAAGDALDINADGSVNVKQDKLAFATDTVDVSGSDITATVSAADLDIRQLDVATKGDNVQLSDGTNDATVTVSGQLNVKDDDLDAATDSVEAHLKDGAGADYTTANPLPVVMSAAIPGDEIVDFQTSAAVAKDASVNHDYTVSAGKEFLGDEAWVSGSGKLKVELLVNGSIVWVGFNSTANPNIRIPTEMLLKAQAAQVIRFTITNRDKQAQDLYSTLAGVEV